MTISRGLSGLLVSVAATLGAPAMAEIQPYAGQDQRAIGALSQSDIDALLAGQGWGFAKAAELNGYPGPRHVLDLSEELALDDAQRAAVQAIFDRMQTRAQALGEEFVAAEAALDAAFANGGVSEAQLAALIGHAGEIEARLRHVHLAAHLETTPVLTRHQRMIYNRARGYDTGAGHTQHDGH